jgi:hypothetical protein
MKDVKRAYFTYPVAAGLLEAATIFASSARDAGLEPLSGENLLDHEFIPIGPLRPLGLLLGGPPKQV